MFCVNTILLEENTGNKIAISLFLCENLNYMNWLTLKSYRKNQKYISNEIGMKATRTNQSE